MPKQEKSCSKIQLHHFSKMYEICMISIFGLWRSTRATEKHTEQNKNKKRNKAMTQLLNNKGL